MKSGPLLYRMTAIVTIVVFLQLLLGGLLTYSFISPGPHIVVGLIIFALAIATMIVALISKPPFRPVRTISIVMVVLILLQIILGFATLNSGSQVIAWLHFVNALAIYGAAVSGTFMAMRWSQLPNKGLNSGSEFPRGQKS